MLLSDHDIAHAEPYTGSYEEGEALPIPRIFYPSQLHLSIFTGSIQIVSVCCSYMLINCGSSRTVDAMESPAHKGVNRK